MKEVEIKFKKTHKDAILPSKKHSNDTGLDISAVENVTIQPGKSAVVPVGLTVAKITEGYWFKIEARSGLGFKHSIQPHFGIIDEGYRGDLGIKLYNNGELPYEVLKGDRIAQLVIYENFKSNVEWVDEVENSERGENGQGSTGR